MSITGRMRRLLGVVLLIGSILSLPVGVGATPGTDDYPRRLKIAAQDALVDPWNFYNRECTSFVAWRLNNDNGVAFHNYYLGVHWGDASNWRSAAVAAGVLVDAMPARGAVAWWAAGSAGSSRGHVAWVQRATASSITIEEYNYLSRGRYDTRSIQRSSSLWPSAFIHVGRAATLKNTARPSIAGTAQVGQRLTAARGSWSMTGLDFSFQWLADGVPIEGATRKGLRLTADQRGAKIQVRVSASKAGPAQGQCIVGGDHQDERSASSRSVSTHDLRHRPSRPDPDGDERAPGLPAGPTPTDGSPAARASPVRRWPTYTPSAAQIGKAIRVEVVATRDGYKRAVSTSSATAKSFRGPFVNSVRAVDPGHPSGRVQLTAAPGVWSPPGHYTYQWFADGVAIAKATSATFTPRAAQLGSALTVRVIATRERLHDRDRNVSGLQRRRTWSVPPHPGAEDRWRRPGRIRADRRPRRLVAEGATQLPVAG